LKGGENHGENTGVCRTRFAIKDNVTLELSCQMDVLL